MKRLIVCIILMTYSQLSNAQSVSTNSYYPDADAFVDNQNVSTNYGSSGYNYLESGVKVNLAITTVRRSFVRFNFSAIPYNAVVVSATLKFKVINEGDATNSSYVLQRINPAVPSSWSETGLTWSTQPATSTSDAINTSSLSGTQRVFDVTSQVSNMIKGLYTNYGWVLKRNNETVATTGSTFKSRHNAADSDKPTLEISYYIPFTVTSATITHANIGIDNGSINATVGNGPSAPTYQWHNSSGPISGQTSNSISGLSPGWYGLQMSGTQGTPVYMAFIVGRNCEEVTINFNPGPNYIQDATLSDYTPNTNSSTTIEYRAGSFSNRDVVWENDKSLMKWNLWVPTDLDINQADLLFTGKAHTYANRSNASKVDLVTGPWTETGAGWYNTPATSSSTQVLISQTTSSIENKTLNILPFWNLWKGNNNNYGFLMQLQTSGSPAAIMNFYSSDATNSTQRPSITFKFFKNGAVSGTVSAGSTSICSGSTTVLTLSGYSTGATFQWQKKSTGDPSFTNIAGATSSTYTTPSSTTVNTEYKCVVTVGTCASITSNTVTITIKPVPTVTVNNASFCSGTNVTLTCTPSIGGGTYIWNTGATTQSIIVSPTSTTNYGVDYTLNGCLAEKGNGTVSVCPISNSFDEETELGQITVDISSAVNGSIVSPYHYIISNYPIADFNSIYNLFRDSVYDGELDSVLYYIGHSSSEQFTFEKLKMGKSHVSVYDSRGTKLLEREVLNNPILTLSNSNGLIINSNVIESNNSNAYGFVDIYTVQNTNGFIEYKLTDKSKTQYMGLVHISETTANSISLYNYGFSVKNNSCYLIENGTEGTTAYTITNSSELVLNQSDNNLEYIIDGIVVKTSGLPSEYYYKSGISLSTLGTQLSLNPVSHTKKKFAFFGYNIQHYNCSGQEGRFDFKLVGIAPSNSFNWTMYKDNNPSPILSGSGASGIVSINSAILTAAGGAGLYKIIGNTVYGGSSYPCTLYIYVGYEAVWSSKINYDNITPNVYSIERTSADPGTYSYAKAENILFSTNEGWIQFKPIIADGPALNNLRNVLRLSVLNPDSYSPVTNESLSFDIIKQGLYTYLKWNGPTMGQVQISPNSVVRLDFKLTNVIEIFVNESYKATIVRPTSNTYIRAHSIKFGDGFDNVISSFGCLQTTQFYSLKTEVEESIAYVTGTKLRIKYNEDYFDNSGQLNYSVRCLNDDVIVTPINVNKPAHSNWIEITIGAGGISLVNGKIYLLEVIDAKGRKEYLKFKKA